MEREASAAQRASMLEDCLHLLLQTVTFAPPPAGEAHQLSALHRKLMHLLMVKPRTYSELADGAALSEEGVGTEQFQAAINAVAVKQSSSSPTLYVLREQLLHDYVPCFPFLSRPDHQAATRSPCSRLPCARPLYRVGAARAPCSMLGGVHYPACLPAIRWSRKRWRPQSSGWAVGRQPRRPSTRRRRCLLSIRSSCHCGS